MKQEGLKERVELLEIGEALGYPRLGYGRSTKIPHDKRIPQGRDGWERFAAHAHVRRILPALRIGRVLRSNNVQVFHPLTAAEMAPPPAPTFVDGDHVRVITKLDTVTGGITHPVFELLSSIDDFVPAPKVVDRVVTALPRPKRGGHKKPQHPNSKRKPRV